MITVKPSTKSSLLSYAKFAKLAFARKSTTHGVLTLSIPVMMANIPFDVNTETEMQLEAVQKFVDALGKAMAG